MNKVVPMPWQSHSVSALRHEFVLLATRPGSNLSDLCRRYQISRKTAYKWLARYRTEGEAALTDRSRRPKHSPNHCPEALETLILQTRDQFPDWGGRKLVRYLHNQGVAPLPSPSTVTEILRRHGRLTPPEVRTYPWQRFEREHPNALWQMDFKGHFALAQGRCYPLTALDDHSRFGLVLHAGKDSQRHSVQMVLTQAFRRYGLPDQINVDHGPPWGSDPRYPVTRLGAWLIRLGITVTHSRPAHPQTNGKIERWHRSLDQEVITRYRHRYHHLKQWQTAFDDWRHLYNTQRPHEALNLEVPAAHYAPSERLYPEALPEVLYDEADTLRVVDANGHIHFKGQSFRIGKGLHRERVALRETQADGVWAVFYCHQRVTCISLNT